MTEKILVRCIVGTVMTPELFDELRKRGKDPLLEPLEEVRIKNKPYIGIPFGKQALTMQEILLLEELVKNTLLKMCPELKVIPKVTLQGEVFVL